MVALTLLAALALPQQAVPSVHSAPPAVGDTAALRHANGRLPPVAHAFRATAGSPRIDGRLDDPVWSFAHPVSGFTQRQPLDGQPATESTVVRIVYDDEAIYIGARMYDSEPARIAASLGRRDNISQSDLFEVDFDSYHDHQTSFQFYTNPLGVKQDLVASTDFSNGDMGWDPVWDVATQRDSLGWTAEFRIPLSQLRFPNSPTQVWGVGFYRYIHRKAEEDWWSYIPRTDNGYASTFGHLFGLEHLPQPQRLEVLPYASGREERLSSGTAGNPFNDGSREVGRLGLDVKYGLTSNLTLNATVNPDFGQVEADPAEVNLTAYETYFSERRPFFVEGADIFRATSPGGIQVNGPQFLYSRRIGRSPQGSADYRGDTDSADEPTSTTILGATKLSGRTAGGWSVGLLEAVTAREYATVDSAGFRFRDQVEPLTNYAVVRAKRDFGNGASTVGFTGTAVNRRLDGSRLDFLRSSAYAGGVDVGHRFNRNRFSVFAALGYSLIRGDTQAIQAAQRSSARYYQRPDADYVEYDASRTSLAGWRAALGFSKDQGSTVASLSAEASSPGFEINDLGYQTRADRASVYAFVGHRWTRPGRVFRNFNLNGSASLGWNFGGDRTSTNTSVSAYGEFLNYWSLNAYVSRTFRAVNDGLLRGGPAGITPTGWFADVGTSSDYRKRLRFYLDVGFGRNDLGYREIGIYSQVMFRPASAVSVTVGPSFSSWRTPQQWVTSVPDPTAAATFGTRYLFAEIFQRSLDLTTRLDVTISPVLSLQLYLQPFVATGDYRRFRELTAPRTTDYATYGEAPGSTNTPVTVTTDGVVTVVGYDLDPDGTGPRPTQRIGNPDFSYRSLRSNAVLRWEYRPGSTMFLLWTTSCSSYGADPAFNATQDFRQLCQGRSDNVFAVKLNYWLSL